MVANVWIQAADFVSTELGELDADAAVTAFKNHDWNSALADRDQLERAGSDFCDPGIGFVMRPGHILHVLSTARDRVMFHYHFEERGRFLGIIPTQKSHVVTAANLDMAIVPELIQNFYSGDHSSLLLHAA